MVEKIAVKALLFDLGDTLMYIPNSHSLEPRLADLLSMEVHQMEELVCQLSADNMGLSADEFVASLSELLNIDDDPDIRREIERICWDSVAEARVQPEAYEVLEKCRRRGYRLLLVSNTSALTKPRLDRLKLRRYFDVIVLSCDVGMIKPDPRIYLLAINSCQDKLDPTEVCIVADKVWPISLGGAIIGSRIVYLDNRVESVLCDDRLAVDAVIPRLGDLLSLPFLQKTPELLASGGD